jgi:type 2A phosphatase activator TIP41
MGILLTQSREKAHEGIKEVVKPFDWSYTTDYKGTITNGKSFDGPLQQDAEPIPIALLKRPDPILFFEEVVLYESELDDNGISIVSCKLRVMPDRMLLLCRLFLRLDDVVVRIRDTRIYVEFATGKVIRDYTEKEDAFDKVKRVGLLLTSGRRRFSNSFLESLILWKITRGPDHRSSRPEPDCASDTGSQAHYRELDCPVKILNRGD